MVDEYFVNSFDFVGADGLIPTRPVVYNFNTNHHVLRH